MKIFVRDFKIRMLIGIYPEEQTEPQDVVVNIDAVVTEPENWRRDAIADWVSYEDFINAVRELAAQGHVGLLETFAHRLAEKLLIDRRIKSVTIRLEKIAAIAETRSVGMELSKENS